MSTEHRQTKVFIPICHELLFPDGGRGPIVTIVDPMKPFSYEAMGVEKRAGTIVECGEVVHETDGAISLQEDGESRIHGRVLGPATIAEVSEAHQRSEKRHLPLAMGGLWMRVAYD